MYACVRVTEESPFSLSPLTAAWGAHMPDDHHLSQARQRNNYIAISVGSAQKKKAIEKKRLKVKVNER